MKTFGTGINHKFHYVDLGSCRIEYGKHTVNVFTYYPLHKRLYIDFDSDYSFVLTISIKNPEKAKEKAKRITLDFLNKDVTIEELVKAGFEHNIPHKRLQGFKSDTD